MSCIHTEKLPKGSFFLAIFYKSHNMATRVHRLKQGAKIMLLETIDHSTLTRLVETGSIRGAHVVGRAGGWSLIVTYGIMERALAAQRSRKIRIFRRMETLITYLKEIGIQRFEVTATDFESSGGSSYSRPDRAEALRHAHEAAAYDKWFREQIESALQEADDPATQWVPHNIVKADMAHQRAQLQARIKGGAR
jgi:hypothetical protein